MNLKTDFTEKDCEYLRAACNFTQEELEVFNLRVKSHSIIEIHQKVNLSARTVERRIHSIKRKISKVL